MYEYITGKIIEKTPTEVVVECAGIGYKLLISLQTYSLLKEEVQTKLYIYHHVREEISLFYGFREKSEREIFMMLINVSGIGPNTARMMLSSLSSDEIREAILLGDVNRIKSIKGIGIKTAQRLIIDLKDKIGKNNSGLIDSFLHEGSAGIREEASSALILLGFSKPNVEKVLSSILKENGALSLEEIIKIALKRL